MDASLRYIQSQVGEIERRLRGLERNIGTLGGSASSQARDTASGLADAVTSALSNWVPRFREEEANKLGDRSSAWGTNAVRYGSAALDRISEETEQRPIIAIVAALGVGILIGMATRSRS